MVLRPGPKSRVGLTEIPDSHVHWARSSPRKIDFQLNRFQDEIETIIKINNRNTRLNDRNLNNEQEKIS